MIKALTELRKRLRLRRKIAFLWGRAWRIRSKFKSVKLRKEANAFLSEHQKNMVFVLGTGRSGTQLISDLLSLTGEASIYHEPNFREDVSTMDTLRRRRDLASIYWETFRSIAIYNRWVRNPDARIYGEVNGTIRYQAPVIKQMYPSAKFFLMTRNGKGVVRSIMGWSDFYSENSKGAYALAPLPGDEFFDEWKGMSRFERVCWSWRDTNETLMKVVEPDHWIQLEKLTSDYDFFNEHFADEMDMDISYEMWHNVASNKSRNASVSYGFPEWNDWSSDQKTSFRKICGATMSSLGYEV